jgi:hypothetical protein
MTTRRAREVTDSVFRVTPGNILGLDHQRFKSQLLALALAEPHLYFRLRDDVYSTIVEQAVEDAYNLYWDMLKSGKNKSGAVLKIATVKYTNPAGAKEFNFVPNLPESEINTFALEVAEAVKDIAERCIEKIMPMEIKDLAVRRSKEILPDV